MYEKEIERILDASQKNALTFFVGAGVSALSGAPTWKKLIDAICDELGHKKKSEYSSDEYLQIPQMYYYSLGDDHEAYYKFIEDRLNTSNLHPNAIHREMLNLDPSSFITTNYDSLLEDAATQYFHSFKVIAQDEDVPQIFGNKYILKLHGDFQNNNFVLKEEDYLNYSKNFQLMETLAKSIFSTNTVVFIGYRLNDYNIKLILNWVKTLLKGNFREPIFLYTGKDPLSPEELLYQKSKGLTVIECNKFFLPSAEYLDRYQSFFDVLKTRSRFSIEGKSADTAFEMLHDLLKPLDSLSALRIEDVLEKLSPYVYISDGGVINIYENNILMSKFFSINRLPTSERDSLSYDIREKYNCILRVFKKARITHVHYNHKTSCFVGDDTPFADQNCILFDYHQMRNFTAKDYRTAKNNYKKAFYFARLRQYDKAFYLFSDVAKQSYKNKDYLLYYLAEANCISVLKAMKSINEWYQCYDMSDIDALSPNDLESENLFNRLPAEFRNTYGSLKDIHSVSMLYRYAYNAFIDGQKLQHSIESHSIELGVTSNETATYRINDYLHFLLGNGIVNDMFTEYKKAIQYLMSLLVYKYSAQNKVSLDNQPIFDIGSRDVFFDEIDFYCFIDCFSDKEIKDLFNKHHITKIEFQHMELVKHAIENLLSYYEVAAKGQDIVAKIELQRQIKTCLTLLRYVEIPQDMVDRICIFILSQEFTEIYINDKIMFLDYQLARRKMYSPATAKIIENTLISYIDKHIAALKNGKSFDLRSTATGMNYYSLVHYIYPEESQRISLKLARRITSIISDDLSPLYPHIAQHYCQHVSKHAKTQLIKWANGKLRESFNFDLFVMLVEIRAPISASLTNQLKSYLRNRISAVRSSPPKKAISFFPSDDPYEELIDVGYWCLIGVLKPNDFKDFLGISLEFDFLFEYTQFDFDKFDVSWLLKRPSSVLKRISNHADVKTHIRSAIAHKLTECDLALNDKQKLQDILARYFC